MSVALSGVVVRLRFIVEHLTAKSRGAVISFEISYPMLITLLLLRRTTNGPHKQTSKQPMKQHCHLSRKTHVAQQAMRSACTQIVCRQTMEGHQAATKVEPELGATGWSVGIE